MLPNADLAYMEPSKVRDYLLSPSQAVGRFKSVVFTSLGYTRENWPLLRDDLLMLARTRDLATGSGLNTVRLRYFQGLTRCYGVPCSHW